MLFITYRFVVPSALVSVLRAEHTIAILFSLMLMVTISSAIFAANFPTLVPPNLRMIQPPFASFPWSPPISLSETEMFLKKQSN